VRLKPRPFKSGFAPAALADDPDAAAPAQLFDPGDEITVWNDIIAFRLHHDHEITLALHIK
jgi:hypothetical protein